MFYSQFGQDKYFSELFPENYKGVCIEIGAYDGIGGSNTLYFENKGWDCLCIEGNYNAYLKCKNIRKNTLNYCISNENNDESIFTIFNLFGDNQSAISSLKPDERLIESHSNLIVNKSIQKVKTRTLTTILNELNFFRDIDFISIDTENTEIDVLNGIDFDYYNIKYLLIENNFNEDKIENFLINKGYKKIYRIAVDDIYMKDELDFNYSKISKYFKIISAHYHTFNKCDKFNSNVTDIVENHLKDYLVDNTKNTLRIINDIFQDRYLHHQKKFFLNYETIIGERCLVIDEWKELRWDKLLNSLMEEYLFYKNPDYNKDITIGELINFTVNNQIRNNEKLIINDIKLDKRYKYLYEKYNNFFNLLVDYNKKYILSKKKYLLLDNKKDNSYEYLIEFKNITNDIVNYEIKIQRIINFFNNLFGVKMYDCLDNKNNIYLFIKNENEIYDKIGEINYLCIEYNKIYVHKNFKNIISSLFKNQNIIFETNEKLNTFNTIILSKYSLNKEILHLYEFKPIIYLCSGRLGDFLNSLSVINEKYYKTGRKGILYISDTHGGDFFKCGVESVYSDLYDILISQNYISDFKIYNNEIVDINLNTWRDFIVVPTTNYTLFYTWKNIFSNYFDVTWAKHKWLNNIYYDELWSNKVIINMTTYRSATNTERVKEIISENKNNIYFITFDADEYEYFINRYELDRNDVKLYFLKSINELCVIINSCKYPYLGISSFAVIANALFKEHSIFYCQEEFGNFTNNMVDILPHMLEFI